MQNPSRIATCTIERFVRFGKTRTSHSRYLAALSITTQKE
jgi:hypothetical protein